MELWNFAFVFKGIYFYALLAVFWLGYDMIFGRMFFLPFIIYDFLPLWHLGWFGVLPVLYVIAYLPVTVLLCVVLERMTGFYFGELHYNVTVAILHSDRWWLPVDFSMEYAKL